MQTPEKNNYEFHEDAGHGWLRVPIADLIELNVQPTEFSYTDGKYAYLEEDEDVDRFFHALDPQWFTSPKDVSIWKKWNIKKVYDGVSSFIRELDSIGKITNLIMNQPTPKDESNTFFPEIFDKFGIKTESAEQRKVKGPMIERRENAVCVIKRLNGWRSDSWYLMPTIFLELRMAELCEKAAAVQQGN